MNTKITAIVLTFNESRNLEDCLSSVSKHVDEIIVVDSFSTDDTFDIAGRYTTKIYKHPFVNYARQFQWALKNTDISNDWILRLDADERWSPDGFKAVFNIIEGGNIDAVSVRIKIMFMGRWIKHGGFYPNDFVRVFLRSQSQIEDRWMDEHIKVKGITAKSRIDVIESNYDRQRNISLWTTKHNNYSSREAVDHLLQKYGVGEVDTIARLYGTRTERKRWFKENIYFRLPLFLRPFLYFTYRYVFKLGFLDGRKGLIFHTLHAFWYRFLVDSKIFQAEQLLRNEHNQLDTTIKELFDIEIKSEG